MTHFIITIIDQDIKYKGTAAQQCLAMDHLAMDRRAMEAPPAMAHNAKMTIAIGIIRRKNAIVTRNMTIGMAFCGLFCSSLSGMSINMTHQMY